MQMKLLHATALPCVAPCVAGLQADLDLGNYERFLDVTLTRDNNLTTGKVYQVGAAVHNQNSAP